MLVKKILVKKCWSKIGLVQYSFCPKTIFVHKQYLSKNDGPINCWSKTILIKKIVKKTSVEKNCWPEKMFFVGLKYPRFLVKFFQGRFKNTQVAGFLALMREGKNTISLKSFYFLDTSPTIYLRCNCPVQPVAG